MSGNEGVAWSGRPGPSIDRRVALVGLGGMLLGGCGRVSGPVAASVDSGETSSAAVSHGGVSAEAFDREIQRLEEALGGRIGVAAILLDAHGQQLLRLEHRAAQRFAMCSTFKWALAAMVLAASERGALELEDELVIHPDDLLPYAPVTREAGGSMSIQELAEACVTLSDNTAANLLLRRLGGPASWTQFMRDRCNDAVSQLDRIEPELNENAADDPRDTTTPAAMSESLLQVFTADVLAASSRALLFSWMQKSPTGKSRLRHALPPQGSDRGDQWEAGDKTGTGMRGACNDVLFANAADGRVLALSCFLSGSDAPLDRLELAHQRVAALVLARVEEYRAVTM